MACASPLLVSPGQSMMLMRKLLPLAASMTSDMGMALMLMPRACSSSLVSVNLSCFCFKWYSRLGSSCV